MAEQQPDAKQPEAKQPTADDVWALRNAKWIVLCGSLVTIAVGVLAVAAGRYGWFATTSTTTTIESTGRLTSTSSSTSTDPGAVRDGLLRLATGVGAVTAGLLAWGRLELSRLEHRLAREEQELARAAGHRADEAQALALEGHRATVDSQITDRFTQAVEQLGHADIPVRLGALYALERIAHDSPGDRPTIFEVICAYVRHHSTRRDDHHQPVLDDAGHPTKVNGLAVDYRAAITIAMRAPRTWHLPTRDLSGAVLTRHVFDAEANLTDVDLSEGTLTGVRFDGATLTAIDFSFAALTGVDFVNATLDRPRDRAGTTATPAIGVTFLRATLTNVKFSAYTTLTDVDFDGATLTKVSYAFAELTDTHFANATLSEVGFYRSIVTNARFPTATDRCNVRFDESTLVGAALPDGFTPGPEYHQHADDRRWYGDEPADPATHLDEI
jgi:uncharacterized protein YjbI with pentapeptide repeats